LKQFQVARTAGEGTHFKVDDDEYVARPATSLPGAVLLDLGAAVKGTQAEQTLAMVEFLRLALEPDSMERFEARLRDPRDPIDILTLFEVANWLMEDVYGGRPTVPPAPSGNGRPSTGKSSTAGVPAKASTRSNSRSTGSST